MTWRSWRSRISTPSLILLITAFGVAFLLGHLTSSFLSELLHLSYPSSQQPADSFKALPKEVLRFQENCTEASLSPEKARQFILDKIFDGVSPFESFPSPETIPLLKKRRIKGWGATAPVFERLIKEVRPTLIVEVGTFLGASAIHMGNVAKNISLHPLLILCVDDFRGWPGFREKKFADIKLLNGNNMLYFQFMKNIQFMNLTKVVLPMPFHSTGSLLALCEWGLRPDLIEIDAGHDFHSAWLDLNFAYAALKPGGVMFGHDYFNKVNESGVRRAVDLFAKLKDLRVEPDGKHWILRSKTSTSSSSSSTTSSSSPPSSSRRNPEREALSL